VIYKDQKKAAFREVGASVTTIDESELARFNRLAEEWWKPKGAFKVVHAFNATRDVGCGAGIVSEPMSMLGAKVTAIDASERNILVAKQHAKKSGAEIDYQNLLPEDVVRRGETFDIVMSLEVIEHVANPKMFLEILAKLVRPGGVLVIGTINRTAISFIKAIIGAEYIMGWLPRGTHSWRKFVRPDELDRVLLPAGFALKSSCGVDFNPLLQTWQITKKQNSTYLRFYRRK
jgi:2-polyprenyl-6-hydroxyphenyl methylase / 3-demethylubiquinone-9 3-methyltransferase